MVRRLLIDVVGKVRNLAWPGDFRSNQVDAIVLRTERSNGASITMHARGYRAGVGVDDVLHETCATSSTMGANLA